jgi:hypothetical protein
VDVVEHHALERLKVHRTLRTRPQVLLPSAEIRLAHLGFWAAVGGDDVGREVLANLLRHLLQLL